MANRHMAGAVGLRREIALTPLDHLQALAERHEIELVGLLLGPAQTALLAEHLDGEAMLAAYGDGGCPQPPDCSP